VKLIQSLHQNLLQLLPNNTTLEVNTSHYKHNIREIVSFESVFFIYRKALFKHNYSAASLDCP